MRYASFLALLALSACDSASPESLAPVSGSWTAETTAQTWLFTSDRDQEIVDASRAGAGDLAHAGAAAGDLRFASASTDREDNPVFTVFSTSEQPLPRAYSFLSLTPHYTTLTVWRDGSYRQYGLSHTRTEAPYTRTDGRLTVSPVTLTGLDGETVTVGGSLVLPALALRAGVESAVDRYASADEDRQLTFNPDGTYRDARTGDRPTVYTGTWEAVGDGRIRIATRGGAAYEVPYRIDGDRLSLVQTDELCGSADRACLAEYERQHLFAPGSIRQIRIEREAVFRRDMR